RASQRMNLPLRELARRLVERCQRQPEGRGASLPPAARRRAADHLEDLVAMGDTEDPEDES
ncbi:MAG TPA: hypothetical protein VFJ85_12820, partial [Acidimicrobiales bacterium]|nr:hypothetical protein [Acidimicrobiales bacterium]